MNTEPEAVKAALSQALSNLLAEGRTLVLTGVARSAHELAQILFDGAAVSRANVLANDLALLNDYAVRSDGETMIGGRDLRINRLMDLGVSEAIMSNASINESDVIEQLIGFMSGPDVEHLRLVGLDADLELTAPLPIGEWELLVADKAFLKSILPVPALARFQPRPYWHPETWAGMAMLRRYKPGRATGQLRFEFPRAHPERDLWKPLTVLALAQPDVVTMWSDHEVEPAREIFERLNRVQYDVQTNVLLPTDPDEFFEVISRYSVGLEAPSEPLFRERVIRIVELLPAETASNASKRQQAAFQRVRLAAQRLLAAGKESVGGMMPLDPVHATDALLHYVVALEALVGQDTDKGDITRKIRQRAAVLAGRDDDERIMVDAEIGKAYALRSRILHGSEEPQLSDLYTLRSVVRKAMVARLVHERRLPPGLSFEQLCDRALLSKRDLEVLREPLAEFGGLELPIPPSG